MEGGSGTVGKTPGRTPGRGVGRGPGRTVGNLRANGGDVFFWGDFGESFEEGFGRALGEGFEGFWEGF